MLLHANYLASYRWGSAQLLFSRDSNLERGTLMRLLNGMSQELAPWTTDEEFVAAVSLAHEAVHYAQDLSTGVGHWDALLRMRAMPSIYRRAAALHVAGKAPPFSQESPLDHDTFLIPPLGRVSEVRRQNLCQRLVGLVDGLDGPEGGRPFQADYVLEAEAAARVNLLVHSLRMSDEQRRIVSSSRSIWEPLRMGSVYSHLMVETLRVVDNWCGGISALEAEQASGVLDLAYRLCVALCDISASHPSPTFIRRSTALEPDEFEPGVRFARGLRALDGLSEDEIKAATTAMVRRDHAALETLLRSKDAYPYPPSADIYAQWLRELDALCEVDDNRVLRLRRDCCAARLDGGLRASSADAMLLAGFPIFCFRPTPAGLSEHPGEVISWYNARYFSEPEAESPEQVVGEVKRKRFLQDMILGARDLALWKAWFESGRVVCPLGEAGACAAAKEACVAGLPLEALPDPSDCSMRQIMDQFSGSQVLPVSVQQTKAYFTDETECYEYVEAELRRLGVDEQAIRTTASEIVEGWRKSDSPPSTTGTLPLIRPKDLWVVRQADLDVARSFLTAGGIGGGLGGLAAAKGALLGPAITIMVGLLGAAFTVHRNAETKGAYVDPIKILILLALRKVNDGKGATPAEVANFVATRVELTPAEVLVELEALSSYPSTGGPNVQLAFTEGLKGLWKTNC